MKQSESLKTLVNLERQYDAIKKLIPEANDILTDASGMQQLLKKRFKYYADSWDLIKLPKPEAIASGRLTEGDIRLATAHLMSMIQAVTHAKRLATEAVIAQKGLKVRLVEFMLRLKEQSSRAAPQKPLPAFSMSKAVPPRRSRIDSTKEKLGKWVSNPFSKKKNKLDISAFDKKAIPHYIKKVLIQIYQDLDYFSSFSFTQAAPIHKKISALQRVEIQAQKKGNDFEASAYNILLEMSLIQLELTREINQIFMVEREKFDDFCKEFLAMLD